MKILHTSDWHLGKRLDRFSRGEEQEAVCGEIAAICDREEIDLVLLCGDLFDSFNPPASATELFYRTLKTITNYGKRPVIAIAGNHDSPDRIESTDPLARACGIILLGYPETRSADAELEGGGTIRSPEPGILLIDLPDKPRVRLLCTPYANEFRLRAFLDGPENNKREESLRELIADKWRSLGERYFSGQGVNEEGINLLMGHLFISASSDSPQEEPEEEKPILHPGGIELIPLSAVPPGVQYAAFGHLHRPQVLRESPCPVIYSGSPLAYSLSEEKQEKHVYIAEISPGRPAAVKKSVLHSGKPIRKKEFDSAESAEEWLKGHPDCYVDITLHTPDYISGGEKKRLFEIHKGILRITPESPMLKKEREEDIHSAMDINKPIKELFMEYFKSEHNGAAPGEKLLSLFDEILSSEEGEAPE